MGALPISSAPLGADNIDPGYGGLVRKGRWLALGSARSASGEGRPALAQTGKARPSGAPSPAKVVLRRRGILKQGAKKGPIRRTAQVLRKRRHSASLLGGRLFRPGKGGGRAKGADSVGSAGDRCAAHSPGMVDLAKEDVRNIKFTGHRFGAHFASRPAPIIDLDASRHHFLPSPKAIL